MEYLAYAFIICSIISLSLRKVYLNLFCILSSALVLVIGYITNNFAFESIYLSSHKNIDLIYKLCALWTTNEGSMLLWILILSIYTAFFSSYVKSFQAKDVKEITLIILCFINIIFIIFLLYSANPFKVFSVVPEDGMGLNPILQDIALSIHPPILYLGYVGSVICFAFSISILITKNYNELNFKLLNKFCLITFTFLSIGVFLGSWWSYRELGWGGFWAWDPVENISLMPWLAILGAIHSLFRKDLKFLALFLSIISFLSSVLGTFITRSGIIESVHSFANDRDQGIYLLIIFLLFFGVSLSIFIIRFFQYYWSQSPIDSPINNHINNSHINKNTFLIILNNIIVLLLFTVLLFGLLYPPLVKLLYNKNIYISNDFYNNCFSYLTIPMIIGIILFPVSSFKHFLEKYKFSLILLLPITFYSLKNFSGNILAGLNIFGWLLIVTITEHYLRTVGKFNIKNILTSRKNPFFLSHVSLGVFLVALSMFIFHSEEVKKYFNIGDSIRIKDYQIKLTGYKVIKNDNFNGVIGLFELYNSKILKPEFRFYKKEGMINAESDIAHFIFDDIYIVISGIDEKLGLAVEIYYRKYIQILWLSFIMLVTGCLLKIYFVFKIDSFKKTVPNLVSK